MKPDDTDGTIPIGDEQEQQPADLHGKLVRTLRDLQYGNPGERRLLSAGSLAIASRADNLPKDSKIRYWIHPSPEEQWPDGVSAWAEHVGCGVFADEIEEVEQ